MLDLKKERLLYADFGVFLCAGLLKTDKIKELIKYLSMFGYTSLRWEVGMYVDVNDEIKSSLGSYTHDEIKEIDDLNEDYDLNIPNEDFQTIGGYVFGLIGREPEIDDVIEDKNITYTVLEMDNRRISRIQMKKTTPFIKKADLESEIQTDNLKTYELSLLNNQICNDPDAKESRKASDFINYQSIFKFQDFKNSSPNTYFR